MQTLSVLLFEYSPLFHDALRSVLCRSGFTVVSSRLGSAISDSSRKYDAVVIDIATFPGTDDQLAALVRRQTELGPVLLLCREDRLDQIITGLKSGAVGVLNQTAPRREIRKAIQAVASGHVWCDRKTFENVARHLLPVKQLSGPRLTRREKEVLQYVGKGQSNKEIASTLCVSEQSVKVYVSNLLRKVGVTNRHDLALVVIAKGVLM